LGSAAAESATAESAAAESATMLSLALSATTESVATESAAAASEVLLPQEAKEIAAKATNMKTNFFIVSLNFLVKQSIAFLKRCKGTDFFHRSKFFSDFFGKYLSDLTLNISNDAAWNAYIAKCSVC
jgi:hypothetical protein